ncbi:hypothetical protein, partial [Burkholderia gladioli]|uniref:hypothetical protein n=1 Tax=Burkholderia gladioli TaxID=28095 RepID=UPI00280B97D2
RPPTLAATENPQGSPRADQALPPTEPAAYEKMQGILQTIDTQNETTLGMLASEQQRVSGVLDEHEPPGDAQASATGEIQDSTRQALAMIGEQLTGLIRQEIESCFRQYVDPLARRLDAIGELLRDIAAIPSEPATPEATATIPIHDTPGPTSME